MADAQGQVQETQTTTTTENTAPSTKAQEGSQGTKGATTQASSTEPKTIQETIAELEAGDFDKFIPVKDDEGQVKKLKVKEVVKDLYATKSQAKRLKEQTQAQVDATIKDLAMYAKTNPKKFLAEIGVDPYEFSEGTLKEKVQMLQETPEQKELRELREYRAQQQQTEAQRKQQEEVSNRTKAEHEEIQRLDVEMASAFKDVGLPKNKFFFQWATALMHDSIVRAEYEQDTKGFIENEPLSAKAALAIVKDKFPVMLKEYLGLLDPNQVKEFVGEELLKKLREQDIARVQNQVPGKSKSSGTPTKTEKEPKVFTKDHEWREYIESKRI